VLGHENAGWVHAVGSTVSTVAPGDPVIVYPPDSCGLCVSCRRGNDMHCERHQFTGLTVDGGFADYVLVFERSVIKLPPGLEPADIAPHDGIELVRRGGVYSVVGYGGTIAVPSVAMIATEKTVQANLVGTWPDL
jgi:D-arabinose 1-dehydrogenase-like Zn-dependent alcohol dehydrogenase